MIWYIEDIDRRNIYITDLWREFTIPKFQMVMTVEEPYLTISWTDTQKGAGGITRTIVIDYQDVEGGYYSDVITPTSAEDLYGQLLEMIDSAWTDISGGGGTDLPDNIVDALINNTSSPSSTNVFITEDELDAAIAGITVGGGFIMPENFSNDEVLGNGTNRTLSSLTYTNGSAAAAWPRVNANYPIPIDVTTMSIDFIAWQEMFYYMDEQGSSSCTTPGGKSYYIDNTLYIPKTQSGVASNRRSRIFLINGNGCICRNSSGGDMILFDRYPDDQTEALNLMVAYSVKMQNFTLIGNSSATDSDILIRMGATLRPIFHNINLESCGIGIDGQFLLEPTFREITTADFGLYGIRGINGQWTGATGSNAQTNIVGIYNFRSYNSPGNTPEAALYFNGGYNIVGDLLTFEGDNGSIHHFHYENTGTTPTDVVKLSNVYFESAGTDRAGIRFQSPRGQFFVEKWHNRVNNTDMPVIIEADNNYDPTNSIHIFITGQAMDSISSKFRAVGDPNYPSIWHVDDVNMNDNDQLNVAANFETGVVTDSYIPLDQYTEFNTKADGTTITGDGTYSRPLTVNPSAMLALIALS